MSKTYVKPHRRKNPKSKGEHRVSGHTRQLDSNTVSEPPRKRGGSGDVYDKMDLKLVNVQFGDLNKSLQKKVNSIVERMGEIIRDEDVFIQFELEKGDNKYHLKIDPEPSHSEWENYTLILGSRGGFDSLRMHPKDEDKEIRELGKYHGNSWGDVWDFMERNLHQRNEDDQKIRKLHRKLNDKIKRAKREDNIDIDNIEDDVYEISQEVNRIRNEKNVSDYELEKIDKTLKDFRRAKDINNVREAVEVME